MSCPILAQHLQHRMGHTGAEPYAVGHRGGDSRETRSCGGGRIEVREYLSVTISFDHDIVDGGPAGRPVHPGDEGADGEWVWVVSGWVIVTFAKNQDLEPPSTNVRK